MAKKPDVAEPEHRAEETWLRSMSLQELRRLARFCCIDLGKQTMDREDMIQAMTMARRDNELTDARFRDLTRPATAFDVTSARRRLEQRAAKENEDHRQALASSHDALQAEITPLKNFANWSKLLASALTIVAGYFGITFWGAMKGVESAEQAMQAKVEKWNETEKTVADLQNKLQKLNNDSQTMNADSQRMIVALSTQASIQIIGKSIKRLDRLRSMKLYHIKPLMEELSLDIESDLRVLRDLREIESFQDTDQHQIVESLYRLSNAIADLRLIYDEDDVIDLKRVQQSRDDWKRIHDEFFKVEKVANTLGKLELAKLKATVYHVEAGLAIEHYRRETDGQDDEDRLLTARKKCALAITEDPNAIMAYIYDGLISSLQISQLREQTMDPLDRIERIDFARRRAEESYRQALKIAARQNAPAELNVYALNNLSYLLVKTSSAYADSAKQPEYQDQREELLEEAAQLLELARDEIKKAETKAVSIDPIVLTTHADIEILNLRFETPETEEEKSVVYNDIRGLLRAAVENGYSGYQGSQEQFFAKRPHFHNLAKLNADYQRDVCQDVGIPYDSVIAMPTPSPRN